MARIVGEIVIDRTPEDVFDFVSNQCNEPLFNPEMLSVEKASDGPIGSGTVFQAVMRQRGRTFPLSIRFTDFERPTRLGSYSEMQGMSTEGALTFEPVGSGSTRMCWSWQVNLTGAMRLMSPLVQSIGRRQELRIWTALKHALEADA